MRLQPTDWTSTSFCKILDRMAEDFSNWVTNHDRNGKYMANFNSKLAYKICSNNQPPPRTVDCQSNSSSQPCSNESATPIGQMGLEMGWFPLCNGVCLIMKKAPSDSPIWQLKKRELLLPLSFLITKPIKLDLSNLQYGPHYRIQSCMILKKITLQSPLQTPLQNTRLHD